MVFSLAIRASGLLLSYSLTAVITKFAGLEVYGVYAITIAQGTILSTIVLVGAPTYITKTLSAVGCKQEKTKTVAVIISSYVLFYSFLLALLSTTFLFELFEFENVIYVLSFAMLLSLLRIRQSIALCFKGSANVLVPDQIVVPVIAIVVVASVKVSGGLVDAQTINKIWIASASVAIVVGYFNLKNVGLLKRKIPQVNTFYFKKAFCRSLPFLFTELPRLLLSSLDVIIVGALIGMNEAGIYAIYSRVAALTCLPLMIINMENSRKFSHKHSSRDMVGLTETAIRSAFCSGALACILALMLILSYELICSALSIKSSSEYFISFSILLAGQVANAMFGSNAILLQMTGHEKQLMFITWLWVLLQVVCLYIAVNLYGTLLSVVCVVAMFNLCGNVVISRVGWRKLGVFVFAGLNGVSK